MLGAIVLVSGWSTPEALAGTATYANGIDTFQAAAGDVDRIGLTSRQDFSTEIEYNFFTALPGGAPGPSGAGCPDLPATGKPRWPFGARPVFLEDGADSFQQSADYAVSRVTV